MATLLTPAQIREARNLSEAARDRQVGEARYARTLAESIYRDLGLQSWPNDLVRWAAAKRLALKRIGRWEAKA